LQSIVRFESAKLEKVGENWGKISIINDFEACFSNSLGRCAVFQDRALNLYLMSSPNPHGERLSIHRQQI